MCATAWPCPGCCAPSRLTHVSVSCSGCMQALFEGSLRDDFLPLARLVATCVSSQPGQEPREPYRFAQPQTGPVFTTRSRGMRRPETRQPGGTARGEEQKPPQPPPPPARSSWWRRDGTTHKQDTTQAS